MPLQVRSHVSRDLLQSAGMFKNERLVVWEYVSNGLEYVDPGTSPSVQVRLDARGRRIAVRDNGRGMDWAGLQNFFVMHGENVDRKAGRPGRGRFGTGKSAAFGIGDVLRITTVRDGLRSQVELSRADLEAMQGGDPVKVREHERELPVDQPNGTLVEIEGIHLRSFDQAGVIGYVERHLAHWPRDVSVVVNHHECEYTEPPVERTVKCRPGDEEAELLGDVELTIKVSKSPLDETQRGIAIFAKGVWHESTLLSSAGKDMSEFLFGELDVARLDDDRSTPPAFDASRSLRLNPDNPLVMAIYAFVAPQVERVRRELVEAQREHRASEEARRLQHEASQIETIINQDFESFRRRLQKMKAAAADAGFDAADEPSEERQPVADGDDFLYGGGEPATIVEQEGEEGVEGDGNGGSNGPARRLNPIVEPADEVDATGHREQRNADGRRPRRGGFHVDFDHQGATSGRAFYQREKRTIFINLDHPQIATARRGHGVEDPVFRRLAYEVAFSEYAIAVAVELDSRGDFFEPQEAITEIRETLQRITVAAAPLYG